jgi:hypothetical protein
MCSPLAAMDPVQSPSQRPPSFACDTSFQLPRGHRFVYFGDGDGDDGIAGDSFIIEFLDAFVPVDLVADRRHRRAEFRAGHCDGCGDLDQLEFDQHLVGECEGERFVVLVR